MYDISLRKVYGAVFVEGAKHNLYCHEMSYNVSPPAFISIVSNVEIISRVLNLYVSINTV